MLADLLAKAAVEATWAVVKTAAGGVRDLFSGEYDDDEDYKAAISGACEQVTNDITYGSDF